MIQGNGKLRASVSYCSCACSMESGSYDGLRAGDAGARLPSDPSVPVFAAPTGDAATMPCETTETRPSRLGPRRRAPSPSPGNSAHSPWGLSLSFPSLPLPSPARGLNAREKVLRNHWLVMAPTPRSRVLVPKGRTAVWHTVAQVRSQVTRLEKRVVHKHNTITQ